LSQQEKKELIPENQQRFPADCTPEDKAILSKFREEGLVGVGRVTESSIFAWFNLYMNGRTYQEIAKETKGKIELVLYMADHYRWFEKRQEHYQQLMARVQNKMTTAKIEGVSFLYDLLSFATEIHKDDIVEFLSTKNKEAAARVDLRIIDRYTKIVDAIAKLTVTPEDWVKSLGDRNRPTVNINIENATIQKDKSILDIDSSKSIVSQLAKLKEEKEKQEK
jgi:hypothetical protein